MPSEQAIDRGRFWGYRGLRPVLAIREVTPHNGIRAGRVLRRWYRAKGLTRHMGRQRVDQHTGRVTIRTTTVRRRLFAANRAALTGVADLDGAAVLVIRGAYASQHLALREDPNKGCAVLTAKKQARRVGRTNFAERAP